MIHQEVSGFSFFIGCLGMCPESSNPLSEFVAYPTRYPICPIFASLEVMSRMSTTLHLSVAYDDTTRQLANCNGNYNFSACPSNILHDFAVDDEVIVTSHLEIVRELYVRRTGSSKGLKKFTFITKE